MGFQPSRSAGIFHPQPSVRRPSPSTSHLARASVGLARCSCSRRRKRPRPRPQSPLHSDNRPPSVHLPSAPDCRRLTPPPTRLVLPPSFQIEPSITGVVPSGSVPFSTCSCTPPPDPSPSTPPRQSASRLLVKLLYTGNFVNSFLLTVGSFRVQPSCQTRKANHEDAKGACPLGRRRNPTSAGTRS